MNDIETISIGSMTVRIGYDEDPFSPREWANLGTMLCNHGRYDLGDEKLSYDEADSWDTELAFWVQERHNVINSDKAFWDYTEQDFTKIWKYIDQNYVYHRLSLYDHSGISMRVGSPTCQWDSGYVGFIVIHKDKILKEFGWKNLTKARREKLEGYLAAEVEEYSKYLGGEVYSYIVEDEAGDLIEACSGFYDYDQCVNEAKSIAEAADKEHKLTLVKEKERLEQENLHLQQFFYEIWWDNGWNYRLFLDEEEVQSETELGSPHEALDLAESFAETLIKEEK